MQIGRNENQSENTTFYSFIINIGNIKIGFDSTVRFLFVRVTVFKNYAEFLDLQISIKRSEYESETNISKTKTYSNPIILIQQNDRRIHEKEMEKCGFCLKDINAPTNLSLLINRIINEFSNKTTSRKHTRKQPHDKCWRYTCVSWKHRIRLSLTAKHGLSGYDKSAMKTIARLGVFEIR